MKCFECPIRQKCVLGFLGSKVGMNFICKDIYHFSETEKLSLVFKALLAIFSDVNSFVNSSKSCSGRCLECDLEEKSCILEDKKDD